MGTLTALSYSDIVTSSKKNFVERVITTSTSPNTKIKAELFYRYKQSDFWRLGGTKIRLKNYGQSYYEFNFANIVNTLLSNKYQTSEGLFTNISECAVEVYIKFTDYYPSSLYVAHDSTLSQTYYIQNIGILTTETQGIYTGTVWYMDSADDNRFLTNSPSVQSIRENERIQLGFITSYTDPIVTVRETKNNGTTADTVFTIGNQVYTKYLWDYTVDEDENVTIVNVGDYSGQIDSLTSTSRYLYMAGNVADEMYGGVELIAVDDILEITLPVLVVATADLYVNFISLISDCNLEVYYYHTGSWHAEATNPIVVSYISYGNFAVTLPSGTTKIRLKKKTGGTIQIPFAYVQYISNNAQNKRCQFSLGTNRVDSDTNKIEVWVEDGSSNVISEVKTYVVDNSLIEDTARIAFSNLRGEFDHHTFKYGYQEDIETEKIRFLKELPLNYTQSDIKTGVAYVNSNIIFTCFTDYETNETLDWLKEIIEAREAYLVINDVNYAIDILTTSAKVSHFSDMQQFELTFKFTSNRNV